MLDDHFWPSIYPGLIVGFLIGLSGRSLSKTLLGACGGLLGAFLVFYVITFFGVEEGIFPVLVIVVGAVLAAKLCLKASSKIKGISIKDQNY